VVLVIGPPKIGKTSVCKKLAEELNMVLLDPQEFFKGIFNKQKLFEEELSSWEPPQEDPENPIPEDQKPKPPQISKYLSPLELEVYNDLMDGNSVKQETLYEIFKLIARSDLAFSRGLIIDQQSWLIDPSFAENLLNGNFGSIIIDYVIELRMPQEELEYRIKSIKHNLLNLETITQRDIELIRKPKKKLKVEYEDDEADENEPQEEEEEKEEEVKDEDLPEEIKEILPKPDDLLEITDLQETFQSQMIFYNEELYPKFSEITAMLGKNYYHSVEVSGFDTDEIVDIIKSKLDFVYPPRPIAKIIEGELMVREGFVPQRRWSLWKQTDPVALIDDFKISPGSNEIASEFCGRVFLFANEENRKKFLENPKKYLRRPPEVPKNYRIAIFGPPKSGKKLIANMLSELYKFKITNMEEILAGVIDYQKKFDEPNLNNVYTSRIHFSQEEFKELIVKKKTPEFYSKIIFWLDSMGIPLDKKKTKIEAMEERKYHSDKLNHLLNPPKPKEEINENELLDENMENNENIENIDNLEEEKNANVEVENPIQKTANNNDRQENKQTGSNVQGTNLNTNAEQIEVVEYVDPFPPEQEFETLNTELKSTQFYYAYDEEYKFPRPGGFILFSHPQTEEEFNKFTEFNITFDKVINLVDLSETPLKSLLLRTSPNLEGVDDEKLEPEINKLKDHVNKIEEYIKVVKEKIGEENVIDINCMDKPDALRLNLQYKLDPFYTRLDNKEDAAGENEDTILPLPKGEYGDFCPVTFKDENWLFYGYKEFEVMVNSRKYIFAGEKERDKFSINPKEYLIPNMKPIDVIQNCPPHIFVSGYQGGGVTSVVDLLSKEYKMAKKELKNEFMAIWNKERLERKNIRIEKKRIEIEKARQEAAKGILLFKIKKTLETQIILILIIQLTQMNG
jgi:adenylate/nucleoside-diphosphate kinase